MWLRRAKSEEQRKDLWPLRAETMSERWEREGRVGHGLTKLKGVRVFVSNAELVAAELVQSITMMLR